MAVEDRRESNMEFPMVSENLPRSAFELDYKEKVSILEQNLINSNETLAIYSQRENSLKDEISSLKNENEHTRTQVIKSMNENHKLRSENLTFERQIMSERDKMVAFQEKYHKLELELENSNFSISNLQDKIKSITTTVSTSETISSDLQILVETSCEQNNCLKQELSALEDLLSVSVGTLKKMKNENSERKNEIERLVEAYKDAETNAQELPLAIEKLREDSAKQAYYITLFHDALEDIGDSYMKMKTVFIDQNRELDEHKEKLEKDKLEKMTVINSLEKLKSWKEQSIRREQSLNEEIADLTSTLQDQQIIKNKIEELEVEKAACKSEIHEVNTFLNKKRDARDESMRSSESLQCTNEELEKRLSELSEELENSKMELMHAREQGDSRAEGLEQEMEMLMSVIDSLQTNQEEHRQEECELNAEIQTRDLYIAELSTHLADLQQSLTSREEQYLQCNSERQQLKETNEILKRKVAEISATVKKTREELRQSESKSEERNEKLAQLQFEVLDGEEKYKCLEATLQLSEMDKRREKEATHALNSQITLLGARSAKSNDEHEKLRRELDKWRENHSDLVGSNEVERQVLRERVKEMASEAEAEKNELRDLYPAKNREVEELTKQLGRKSKEALSEKEHVTHLSERLHLLTRKAEELKLAEKAMGKLSSNEETLKQKEHETLELKQFLCDEKEKFKSYKTSAENVEMLWKSDREKVMKDLREALSKDTTNSNDNMSQSLWSDI